MVEAADIELEYESPVDADSDTSVLDEVRRQGQLLASIPRTHT